MKMHQKIQFLLLACVLLSINTLQGQDTIPQDPLLRFKYFGEMGATVNAMRVNTNNTSFITSNGQYDFIKNKYLVSTDVNFNFGIHTRGSGDDYSTIYKTGIHALSRLADLNDNNGNEVRLTTTYIQIPVQVGLRYPLQYNNFNKNLFKAVELHYGFYASIPIMQKLDHRDNVDSKMEYIGANYIRFGLISELIFTALNSKGYGHKFGIRASWDFKGKVKFKETDTELYPFYVNIGVFYNIRNKYK